ncbi:MAG TPA: DUF4254 domain-containing protein [Pirellulaceae bacterium]|nr:DUF4254 domain-containing protein [Pirellulaceae bacterium]
MIRIDEITTLQRECVSRWHQEPVDQPHEGLLGLVCQQHAFNFRLWHEEDKARSREAGDSQIAAVKRAIDQLNQQRNDWIERLDDWITEALANQCILAPAVAPQNTETLGSTIDRLSILALRIYHLAEERDRPETTPEHREAVGRKLAVALAQLDDLSLAAQQLADDLFAGRKRHKTYRQLKMYNDPALNPYLYRALKVA